MVAYKVSMNNQPAMFFIHTTVAPIIFVHIFYSSSSSCNRGVGDSRSFAIFISSFVISGMEDKKSTLRIFCVSFDSALAIALSNNSVKSSALTLRYVPWKVSGQ